MLRPVTGLRLRLFPARHLYPLSCLGGLSRSAANWLRLALLLASFVGGSSGTSFLGSLTLRFRDTFPKLAASDCPCDPPAATEF